MEEKPKLKPTEVIIIKKFEGERHEEEFNRGLEEEASRRTFRFFEDKKIKDKIKEIERVANKGGTEEELKATVKRLEDLVLELKKRGALDEEIEALYKESLKIS